MDFRDEEVVVRSGPMEAAEIGNATEVLTRVDIDLDCSGEKLSNLDMLLMHVLSSENDLEAMALDNEDGFVEKALLFDLLSGILESEVNELSDFLDVIQELVFDARQKISILFEHERDLFFTMEDKLKQSQDQVDEIKKQSAKLQKTSLTFKNNDCKTVDMDNKPKMQTIEQKRHILRMLEKSIAREIDLEKKLTESKQNEEDLKLKIRLTQRVVLFMEETTEVVWGRFLESDIAREVLMGISKEVVGRLQITQFTLNNLMKREDNSKSDLQVSLEKIKDRESALLKLESHNSELVVENSKVKLLEERLRESELQLKNTKASNEEHLEQMREMENLIDSLKENLDIIESRAESAETKVVQLTETNVELSEETSFLKNEQDNNTKKTSSLEKQVRKLENQLQQAKASFEAGQEQQNMLYAAIWDMETLIEELKSKVSKSEIKSDNAEEECTVLSETNLRLNNELTFLRTKVENLETSLEQANEAKVEASKEINLSSKFIKDMVTQIAFERERIKKQLSSLTTANTMLVEKLSKSIGAETSYAEEVEAGG
ncbi:WPP domain-interacting tail-anchored protein 2 isoform X2 [Impatiens glandulifera]|uniref:WPP domain-interacting tail-anchored protein 2 isoform X2 n=1 Tax=Impatiens glandulifera TaxID=253017 RepID=UPI001FB14E98|nr:WPP domain-interacting tail-anchored protein 2 isoform X2 [Impatiens glandulifera]